MLGGVTCAVTGVTSVTLTFVCDAAAIKAIKNSKSPAGDRQPVHA